MLRAYAHKIWFTAAPATNECEGCAFDNEPAVACREAWAAAKPIGLPDCIGPRDVSTHIYVRDPSDGRQADLLIGGEV